MASIVERIRSNDPELAEIRLTEDPIAYCADMSELIDAMHHNSVINYIRLDRDFLPNMKDENVPLFFNAIGQIPSLKEIHIWHASLPVKVVASFVEHANKLEYLELGCLDLEGSEVDFNLVSNSLRGHPTLKMFAMTDFSLNDDTVAIDGLIETLATIPNIEIVKLEVTTSRRSSLVGSANAAREVKVTLTGKSLATLCRCNTLKELLLNRLHLKLDDVAALAEALKTAPSLQKLALPHCGLDDAGADALAKAIGENQTLEKIDLSCNKLSDEGCIVIATALKGNRSVKILRLWGNVKISNAGFAALAEMVENNCVLERVPLMVPMGRTRISPEKRAPANHAA